MPKNSTRELALKPVIEKAVEVYASKPDIRHQDAAEMLGVSENTLYKLRRDPNFWEQVYNYYMVTFEGDVVAVLRAMVREALAGNTTAGRLVLEHSGKLQKNINVTISSPFEKWMEKVEGGVDVVDAEIIDNIPEFSELPPRTADNSPLRAKEELNKLQNSTKKAKTNKKRADQRKESRMWLKRAKAVGIEKLPARRPTPGQKKAWQEKIIAKEKQAS